jgi:hypothetical protein
MIMMIITIMIMIIIVYRIPQNICSSIMNRKAHVSCL